MCAAMSFRFAQSSGGLCRHVLTVIQVFADFQFLLIGKVDQCPGDHLLQSQSSGLRQYLSGGESPSKCENRAAEGSELGCLETRL